MNFSIDPKDLSLQDAAGMQLVEVIRNLADESGTADYEDLENLPKINGVELKGNKTSDDLHIAVSDEQVATAVDAWLEDNVDPETGYVLDSTLTMSNAAAPANEVGELKSELNVDIDGLDNGKRYFNYTWGTINSDGTINYNYDPKVRIVTDSYDKFDVETDVVTSAGLIYAVALYNDDYTLISRTAYYGAKTITIPANTYFRITINNGDVSAPNPITEWASKVFYTSEIQKKISDFGLSNVGNLTLDSPAKYFYGLNIKEGDRVKTSIVLDAVGSGAKNVQLFHTSISEANNLHTFYETGEYYFYAPSDIDTLAFRLYTAGSLTSVDVDVQVQTGFLALPETPRVYYCEKDGSGDFTKLSDAVNTACQYMDSTIYVGAGTWDLIDELGSAYVETISSSNRGLYLKNRVHLICNPDSKITWNYTGSTADVIEWGCAFNSGEYGFTLENANIETSNCRYSVHDERDYATDFYENKYINCVMKQDNTDGGSKQCIGGGLGKNGRIVIHGCIFESVKYNTETEDAWIVSYHNTWNPDGGKSFIEVSDCYFKGHSTMHFGWFGNSTEKTPILCTCNSLGHSIYFERETSEDVGVSTDIVNLELYEWNNIVRS